ncbi:MAG: branched-chain amino acid transport system / permease component family protein [Bacillales bacterium]|nr:branched-chain amino acid transport system / permease component family protein [Bacillales bacterium]
MLENILRTLPQVLFDGITLGTVYAVIALGYTMVYGILKLINFAHGEIFMTGAFIGTAILLAFSSLGWIGTLPIIILVLVAMFLTAGVTGAIGVGIERIAYRPLRKAPKLIALISAIGISFLLQDLVRFTTEFANDGNFYLIGPELFKSNINVPLSKMASFLSDASFKTSFLFVLVTAVALMIILDVFVNKTKWGMAMRAVAQDRDTAALMGVNVNKTISLTFFIGSALGGATGVLFAVQYGTIDPYIGFILGLKAFTAAVLGGIGNIRGAVLGGLIIGVVEMFAAANLSTLTNHVIGAEYKDVFAFIILILVLLFKPEGLLGKALHEKV